MCVKAGGGPAPRTSRTAHEHPGTSTAASPAQYHHSMGESRHRRPPFLCVNPRVHAHRSKPANEQSSRASMFTNECVRGYRPALSEEWPLQQHAAGGGGAVFGQARGGRPVRILTPERVRKLLGVWRDARRSPKRSTHARPGMHMQQCGGSSISLHYGHFICEFILAFRPLFCRTGLGGGGQPVSRRGPQGGGGDPVGRVKKNITEAKKEIFGAFGAGTFPKNLNLEKDVF